VQLITGSLKEAIDRHTVDTSDVIFKAVFEILNDWEGEFGDDPSIPGFMAVATIRRKVADIRAHVHMELGYAGPHLPDFQHPGAREFVLDEATPDGRFHEK